jgi:hypothetical protein
VEQVEAAAAPRTQPAATDTGPPSTSNNAAPTFQPDPRSSVSSSSYGAYLRWTGPRLDSRVDTTTATALGVSSGRRSGQRARKQAPCWEWPAHRLALHRLLLPRQPHLLTHYH